MNVQGGNAKDKEWMTTKEAADYLGCSARTLAESRQQGRRVRAGPPYHRVVGGIRYHRPELDAYRQEQRQESRRAVPPRPNL